MFTRGIAFLLAYGALVPLFGAAPVRRPADGRATMVLDELAKLPEGHAVQAPREVYDPEMIIRPHADADVDLRLPREPETPGPAPLAATPAYSGFLGLGDNHATIPPDTDGAISPQYVVTMLNSQVMIQGRDGTARANYPINLGGRGGFWSKLTTVIDVFDPNIRYDALADRWIASASMSSQSASSALLVAVSQTGDPGGAWNMYKIAVGSSGDWGDYPVLGFNGNWVVVSLNLFTVKGDNYVNTTLYVFSKSDLYNGGQGNYVTFTDPNGEFIAAADYDNSQPNTMYFVRTFAGDIGVNNRSGTFEISQLRGPVGLETFSAGNGGQIIFNAPWSDSGANGADFLPQNGTTKKIDAGDSRMQNCVLRKSMLWCAHTIFLPFGAPTRSAVQWFQVDPSNALRPTIVQRGRIDDSSGTYFYAYPTIAVNGNGDVLVGYNRFSAQDYPSAEFSYRLATDPASTLEPDVLYLPGQASYVASGFSTSNNRWGDFSRTWVDPLDDLTFWTIQEYAVPPTFGTGQFATWWEKIAAPSQAVSTPPAITTAGIVNAASYQGGGVAPGELITMFGAYLGPASLQKPVVSAAGVVDTVAGGTRVTFDNTPATMIYSSTGQVAAVAPYALQGKTQTVVQVSYVGNVSNTVILPVIATQPAIFTGDASGQGEGAILNQDQSVNSTTNPAARGSVITIYATGGGALPGVVEGTLAGPPFPQYLPGQVTATVGGQAATVDYAGVAPFIVTGVIQVNVTIPSGITPGSAVPVSITIGGVTSKAGVTVVVN